MSDLRNKVIKLAHDKPELRKHLLPLLKKAVSSRKGDSGAILDMLTALVYVRDAKANSWTSIENNIRNNALSFLLHAKRRADHNIASYTAERMIDYVDQELARMEREFNSMPLTQFGGVREYSFRKDLQQLAHNMAMDIHGVITDLINDGVPLDPSLEAEVNSVKLPGRIRWHMLKGANKDKTARRMTEFIVEDQGGNRASLVLPSSANPLGDTNPLTGQRIKYIVTDITPPGDYSRFVPGPWGETNPISPGERGTEPREVD